MKIRTGFVSNSSSSSFLVAFKEKPSSAEELQKLLFEDVKEYPDQFHKPSYSTSEIAEIVFRDIVEEKISDLSMENLCNSILDIGGYLEEYPDDVSEDDEDYLEYLDTHNKQAREFAKDLAETLLKECEEEKIYIEFSYCDEMGSLSSALEHGNLFYRLNHVTISCH